MSYNINKLVDALTIFAKNNQELTKLRINKLLYFVDKEHLRNFGRLVFNDSYISLRCGPVAERSNNIINDFIDCEYFKSIDPQLGWSNYLSNFFELSKTSRGYDLLKLKQESDASSLSASELETIDSVLKKYGNRPTSILVDFSHDDAAWANTPQNEEIDYKLLLEGLPEDKKTMISELIDLDQENAIFLGSLSDG